MTRTIIGPVSEGERRLLTVLNQIFEIEKSFLFMVTLTI